MHRAPKILGERNPSGFLCPGSAPPRFFRRQTSDSSTIGTVIPCPSPQGDHQNFRSASIMKQVGDWIYSSYCKWYFQDNQQSTKYGQPLGMTAPEVVKPGCCLSACFAITWYVEKQMVLLYSQTSAKKCTLLGCTWYLTTPFKVALKYVEIQSSQSASPSVATAHLASAAGCSPPPGHGFAHDHMEVTRPRKLGSFTSKIHTSPKSPGGHLKSMRTQWSKLPQKSCHLHCVLAQLQNFNCFVPCPKREVSVLDMDRRWSWEIHGAENIPFFWMKNQPVGNQSTRPTNGCFRMLHGSDGCTCDNKTGSSLVASNLFSSIFRDGSWINGHILGMAKLTTNQ